MGTFIPETGITKIQLASSKAMENKLKPEDSRAEATHDEYCREQPECGFPIRLPKGATELTVHDSAGKKNLYMSTLQKVMRSTRNHSIRDSDDMIVTQTHTQRLNVLTLNLGNLERPPAKPDKKAGALSESVILGMIRHNSSHILCLQEADGILNQLVRETIRNAGYTGIVISQAGAKGIGCFAERRSYRPCGTSEQYGYHQLQKLGDDRCILPCVPRTAVRSATRCIHNIHSPQRSIIPPGARRRIWTALSAPSLKRWKHPRKDDSPRCKNIEIFNKGRILYLEMGKDSYEKLPTVPKDKYADFPRSTAPSRTSIPYCRCIPLRDELHQILHAHLWQSDEISLSRSPIPYRHYHRRRKSAANQCHKKQLVMNPTYSILSAATEDFRRAVNSLRTVQPAHNHLRNQCISQILDRSSPELQDREKD